jgi:cysteine desulfurase
MYGPKGVGVLYVRKKDPKIEISPLFYGGGHERKLRSGTLNVPGIVGLGKAAALCQLGMQEEAARLRSYRDIFWNAIKDLSGVRWNGQQEKSLSHVANICFDLPGGDNLIKMLTKHISVSSGSACSSAIVAPSHVLKAMGLSDAQAHASIRFSMGRFTTREEVDTLVEEVSKALTRMQ